MWMSDAPVTAANSRTWVSTSAATDSCCDVSGVATPLLAIAAAELLDQIRVVEQLRAADRRFGRQPRLDLAVGHAAPARGCVSRSRGLTIATWSVSAVAS